MAITTIKQSDLRKALQSVGWNQADLARKSKISPQEIGRIIGMKAKPTPEQAIKILKAFRKKGCEIDLLVLWPENSEGYRKKPSSIKSEYIPLEKLIHSSLPQLQIQSGEMDIIDVVNNEEIVQMLMEALSDREKIAVQKHFFEDETYQSIADHFNVSTQRALQIFSEAIRKMKKRARSIGVICHYHGPIME